MQVSYREHSKAVGVLRKRKMMVAENETSYLEARLWNYKKFVDGFKKLPQLMRPQ